MRLIIFALISAFAYGFVVNRIIPSKTFRINMSEDPLDAIRAKVAADPSYNPMADPEAMKVLESYIPDALREIPNAINRLKVSYKDNTQGEMSSLNAAVKDLDFENKISSPTSKWFQNGRPNPGFSASKKKELFEAVLKEKAKPRGD